MSAKIALIYHSGNGHTAFFAQAVAKGARSVAGTEIDILEVAEATKALERLDQYQGFLFGSPTYMGNVSGPFKTFMDATGGLWGKGALKNRWAGGFTVSGSPSGDKLLTLQSLAIFAAQHGMFWVGNHIIPETYQGVPEAEAANRLGSFLGVMAQAGPVDPAKAFVPGDLKTAHLFGERFARVVASAPKALL
jgi:NAD(P)H dehydrogenase (quinone)